MMKMSYYLDATCFLRPPPSLISAPNDVEAVSTKNGTDRATRLGSEVGGEYSFTALRFSEVFQIGSDVIHLRAGKWRQCGGSPHPSATSSASRSAPFVVQLLALLCAAGHVSRFRLARDDLITTEQESLPRHGLTLSFHLPRRPILTHLHHSNKDSGYGHQIHCTQDRGVCIRTQTDSVPRRS